MGKSQMDVLRSFILGALFLSVVLFGYNRLKSSKTPPARKPLSAVPVVEAVVVQNKSRTLPISLSGKLLAEQRIELFSEAQGIMLGQSNRFRAGARFAKGEIILSIDDTEASAALVAQRSNYIQSIAQLLPDLSIDHPQDAPLWKEYLSKLNPERDPPPLPEPSNETLRLFLTARNVYANYHNLQGASNRLSKYKIRAPFNGVLADAQLTEGSLVRPGQRLGSFIAPGRYELETSISSSQAEWIKVGTRVELRSDEVEGRWMGTVVRINEKIDESTQSIRVFLRVEGEALREGQYVHGRLNTRNFENVFAYPRLSLFQDRKVFVINDSTLSLHSIEIVASARDSVLIRGLEQGTRLIKNPVVGAYDGMKIRVTEPARP